LQQQRLANEIWQEFSEKFGALPLPGGVSICYGKSYFSELKDGARMQSVLDRRRHRIILRRNKASLLRHEIAHLYLDLSWKVLPYSVSEPLAQALAYPGNCTLKKSHTNNSQALADRWKNRGNMNSCEKQKLFSDILSAAPEARESLPLR